MEMDQSQVLWATRTFDDEVWDEARPIAVLRAGAIGGMTGGAILWVYQALVWVGAQHLMPLSGIPLHPVGIVFGQHAQLALGPWAYVVGTCIHFVVALAWGVVFAVIWPYLRRREYEATLVALGFALVAWVVMYALLALTAHNHAASLDPLASLGGVVSHIVFAVPMALTIKLLLREEADPSFI